MRKFRTAAVAAATAFSLTIAGTGVAAAEDDAAETNTSSTSSIGTSSQIGADKGASTPNEETGDPEIRGEHQVIGTDLLGSSEAEGNPQWSEDWKKIAYVGVAGSIIGAIVAGINWLKFQGILPY